MTNTTNRKANLECSECLGTNIKIVQVTGYPKCTCSECGHIWWPLPETLPRIADK